jgi:hypothetical protein
MQGQVPPPPPHNVAPTGANYVRLQICLTVLRLHGWFKYYALTMCAFITFNLSLEYLSSALPQIFSVTLVLTMHGHVHVDKMLMYLAGETNAQGPGAPAPSATAAGDPAQAQAMFNQMMSQLFGLQQQGGGSAQGSSAQGSASIKVPNWIQTFVAYELV